MPPLVSIIITNYNYGRFLGEAIESALAQTWQNREILFIDDGSTDDSVEVARRYPITLFTQKNSGVCIARNNALSVAREHIRVIPVGAEEALFTPQPWPHKAADAALELAFFGTFIGLQGVDVLAQAILHYDGPPTHWRLIGEGPLKADCERLLAPLAGASGPSRVSFEGWGPLPELPGRLASADAILGIFGTSDKALRVIPNKVYQGLALGRAVITAATPAFLPALRADEEQGLLWAQPGEPASICAAVERLHQRRDEIAALGQAARASYEAHYSNRRIAQVLGEILDNQAAAC